MMRAAAFSVHIFTALGAGVALIALLEAVREHWAAMFWWLGAALVIDGVDGHRELFTESPGRVLLGTTDPHEILARADGANKAAPP